jgi:RNA polymerase sigma-70 factor (ECF subfamily)
MPPTAAAEIRPVHAAEDEAALVREARAGDRAALARLHALYEPMVHGILLSRLGVHDAEDLVQDVFARVILKLRSLREDRAFGAWVAAMARNAAASLRRKRPPSALDDSTPAPSPRPLAGAEAEEVLSAIRAMPDAYSETLMLRLVEGLTGPEIALRTGMTEGSVRVNLHRGMKLLRSRLGAEEEPR